MTITTYLIVAFICFIFLSIAHKIYFKTEHGKETLKNYQICKDCDACCCDFDISGWLWVALPIVSIVWPITILFIIIGLLIYLLYILLIKISRILDRIIDKLFFSNSSKPILEENEKSDIINDLENKYK